jgi:hypothetical protein
LIAGSVLSIAASPLTVLAFVGWWAVDKLKR